VENINQYPFPKKKLGFIK